MARALGERSRGHRAHAGSESNVKEIYDACALLERDPTNVVLNQFCEFGNHLAHRLATGRAIEALGAAHGDKRFAAFVSAPGSAGTLAAGDALKERFGSLTVAVEALECPTLLRNGFGEHNIQGIGDKHVPYIHNVMSTDVVTACPIAPPTRSTCSSTRPKGSESSRVVGCPPTSSPASEPRPLLDLQPRRIDQGRHAAGPRFGRSHRQCRDRLVRVVRL